MHYLISLLFFAISTFATAQSLIPADVEYFKPGNNWVWEYKDYQGRHTSFEKYEVKSRSGDLVTITMQSQLAGANGFTTHHMFQVKLSECQRAYRNYGKLKKWHLKGFFYKSDEGWVRVGDGSNTQAFEEKFSCHKTIDAAERQFKHRFEDKFISSIGDTVLVTNEAIRPKKGHYDSQYIFQPYELGGIAAYKVFNPGMGKDEYSFELVDWQM